MEENELKFTNTEKACEDFINDFIKNYKSFLIRDDKKATGNLIKSIEPIEIEIKNSQINGYISLANYWKYVEYGRKKGGKFPPVDKILKWIIVKPVIPRPKNGIKPTEKQLAFLISRKIARDGIEAGSQYEEALNKTWEQHKDRISNAITMDIEDNINLIMLPMFKF